MAILRQYDTTLVICEEIQIFSGMNRQFIYFPVNKSVHWISQSQQWHEIQSVLCGHFRRLALQKHYFLLRGRLVIQTKSLVLMNPVRLLQVNKGRAPGLGITLKLPPSTRQEAEFLASSRWGALGSLLFCVSERRRTLQG